MITSNGTKLLGKYLVGQVPTFASHIAIGCGPNVLGSDESFGSYSSQTSLDFEMARVPIISRTTNVIDGETQVIFTGTIPSGDRYGITEVGIYPAEESNVFGSPPSKTLFAFTDAEDWQHHDVSAATFYDTEIYTLVVDSNQDIDSGSGGTMENITAFRLASDNAMFRSETRLQRQEQPRFLNRSVVLRGDYTALDGAALDYTLGDHLMLTKPNLAELDKAHAINDKIKVAFSIIPKSLATPVTPTNIQLTIDFAIDDGSVERARLEYTGSTTNNDRYIVVTKTLNELDYTTSFKWENVNYIKIYANIDNGTDNYLALDGIRYENESSVDTQYSLVGYSILKSSDTVASEYPRPIEKIEGSTTYVEFRFVLDVV